MVARIRITSERDGVAFYGDGDESPEASSQLFAITAPTPAVAKIDHEFLCSLWAAQSSSCRHPGCGMLLKFQLEVDASRDRCIERAAFSDVQLDGLRAFLRSRLFDVWKAIAPNLERLHGSFELFNPDQGANMGWHQDGHGAGEYIAHYYLGLDSAAATTSAVPMDWFEVAVPVPAEKPGRRADESSGECDEDDEPQYTVDFGADPEAHQRLSAPRLALFPVGRPTQRLVVFEDAAVFHRTPLTAHAVSGLQARRQRPIARIVFRGANDLGHTLGWVPSAVAAAVVPAAVVPAAVAPAAVVSAGLASSTDCH